MTRPAWLARAVFYDFHAPDPDDANGAVAAIAAKLDYLAELGVNAVSLGPLLIGRDGHAVDTRDAGIDALLDAAHACGIRVCVRCALPPASRAATELRDALRVWFDRGVDALRIVGIDADADDPYRIDMRRRWREMREWVDATYRDRALIAEVGHPEIAIDAGFDVDVAQAADATGWDTLLLGADTLPAAPGEPYFDSSGRGDFGRFLAAFEFQRRRIGDGWIGLPSSVQGAGRASQQRDADDRKVLFTFLLTWPGVPFVSSGDELGARDPGEPTDKDAPTDKEGGARRDALWHHVERLVYLRVTESDLAADAAIVPITDGRGYPLVYRRGATLIVALNPGLTSHVVALPPLGDAAPVLEHHCHVSHGAAGWQLKIGSRGYAVFTVR